MHDLGINKNAVVSWNNYMSEVYAADLLVNPVIIRGSETTVEVDESLFTGVKNHQGRQLLQQWVFSGICREMRECSMYTDRGAATLLPIIQESIRLITWTAYGGI